MDVVVVVVVVCVVAVFAVVVVVVVVGMELFVPTMSFSRISNFSCV